MLKENEWGEPKTVGDLKKILEGYPDDMRVVYDYCLGLTVSEFELDTVVLNFSY